MWRQVGEKKVMVSNSGSVPTFTLSPDTEVTEL